LDSRICDADENEEMEKLRAYNRKLLANILPEHVTEHFMTERRADVRNTRRRKIRTEIRSRLVEHELDLSFKKLFF
jgi:hypothetical protein